MTRHGLLAQRPKQSLIAAARPSSNESIFRAAAILLISRAAAPPTPRAYRPALWAAGIKG